MRVRIRGRYWRLIRARLVGKWGDCDEPEALNREIRIHDPVRDFAELDVLIHEMLHAAYPDLSEDAVTTGATDIASVLWRLGFRKPEEDDS